MVYRQNHLKPNIGNPSGGGDTTEALKILTLRDALTLKKPMYKAINKHGERRLFKKLRPACEFAGVSYFATRNALMAGRLTEKVQEVDKKEVKVIGREKVLFDYIVAYWEGEDYPFAMMEPDGSILFV